MGIGTHVSETEYPVIFNHNEYSVKVRNRLSTLCKAKHVLTERLGRESYRGKVKFYYIKL
jgi:hypothetical protein